MDAKKISKYIIAVCALIGTIVGAIEVFQSDVKEIQDPIEVKYDSTKVDTNEVK